MIDRALDGRGRYFITVCHGAGFRDWLSRAVPVTDQQPGARNLLENRRVTFKLSLWTWRTPPGQYGQVGAPAKVHPA